jgi:diacylglycerol kinase (ATP)
MINRGSGLHVPGYHPIRKIRVVLSGLRYVILHDFSVTYKLVLSAILLVPCFWLRQWLDFLLILTVTGVVLVAEILNTAIERLCDFVEPTRNERIKIIKDVAAAGVGIGIFAWSVVVLAEFWRLGMHWFAGR